MSKVGGDCRRLRVDCPFVRMLFFVPIQMKIQAIPGTGLSSEEIVNLANRFVLWHSLKLIVGLTAFAAGLQALAKFNSPDAV